MRLAGASSGWRDSYPAQAISPRHREAVILHAEQDGRTQVIGRWIDPAHLDDAQRSLPARGRCTWWRHWT
jgi:hypothetical protein